MPTPAAAEALVLPLPTPASLESTLSGGARRSDAALASQQRNVATEAGGTIERAEPYTYYCAAFGVVSEPEHIPEVGREGPPCEQWLLASLSSETPMNLWNVEEDMTNTHDLLLINTIPSPGPRALSPGSAKRKTTCPNEPMLSPEDSRGLSSKVPPSRSQENSDGYCVSPNSAVDLSTSPPSECHCVQRVVFLIEELEPKQGLDDALASHKEALRHGERLLSCHRCSARPENLTILTFLTDKLANLWEHFVGQYLEGFQRQSANSSSAPNKPISLGSYEIESSREWVAIIEVLARLQLGALHAFLGHLMQWDLVRRKAEATRRRLISFSYKMNSAWKV